MRWDRRAKGSLRHRLQGSTDQPKVSSGCQQRHRCRKEPLENIRCLHAHAWKVRRDAEGTPRAVGTGWASRPSARRTAPRQRGTTRGRGRRTDQHHRHDRALSVALVRHELMDASDI